jgi:hypothetical protein
MMQIFRGNSLGRTCHAGGKALFRVFSYVHNHLECWGLYKYSSPIVGMPR